MKTSDILIPVRISGLSDGIHEFDLTARPLDIGLPPEFGESLSVHVHLDKTHSQVVLDADVRAAATYPCDRCLEPVRIPVEQSFVLLFARDSAEAKMADDEDVRIIDPNAPVIDIGEDVRDVALIAIPMKRVCGEDEHGDPICKDANTAALASSMERAPDPRWAALEKLNEQHEHE